MANGRCYQLHGLYTTCSINFGSIPSQKLAFFSLTIHRLLLKTGDNIYMFTFEVSLDFSLYYCINITVTRYEKACFHKHKTTYQRDDLRTDNYSLRSILYALYAIFRTILYQNRSKRKLAVIGKLMKDLYARVIQIRIIVRKEEKEILRETCAESGESNYLELIYLPCSWCCVVWRLLNVSPYIIVVHMIFLVFWHHRILFRDILKPEFRLSWCFGAWPVT